MTYRLHLPSETRAAPALLVALHGCRQSAEDFAYGTRFDVLADRYGSIVLYPEQDERRNGHRCWNWFRPENQTRQGPEPAAILAIVDEVGRVYDVDRSRIFIVGLSAGASMAAILATEAPDVFSGAGLMAGVALHAAHDVESAYAVMRGELAPKPFSLNGKVYDRSRAIIWTGRNDRRVTPANAWQLGEQFRTLYRLRSQPDEDALLVDGRRARWHDRRRRLRLEVRELAGIGHAWSGGSLRGSYTAPAGPNFSEAVLRFLFEETRMRVV